MTKKEKKGKRRAVKGFSGKRWVKDAEFPLLTGVGVYGGKLIYDLIGKGSSVAGFGNNEDEKKATSYLQPAILVAGGIALPQFTNYNWAKAVGAGIALYGGIAAAKNYAGKDVLGNLHPNRRYDLSFIGLGNTRKLSRVQLPPANAKPSQNLPKTENAGGEPRYGDIRL